MRWVLGKMRLIFVIQVLYRQRIMRRSEGLLLDVKPNVPWVRLAQRVPVRIRLLAIPPDLVLIAGTTCTITIGD